jgi:penicillin-binding protein 1C
VKNSIRLGLAFLAASLVGFGAWCHAPLPRTLLDRTKVTSAEYWSVDGQLLRVRLNAQGARCMWRTTAELAPSVEASFIALEDKRFADHSGLDERAVARAFRDNATGRERSGASTLSMQLATLLTSSHEHSWRAKLAQAALALKLERHLTKKQILEEYLNRVPLGRGLVGVEAAARAYFGHGANLLTPDEALFLASMTRAPSRLDPRSGSQLACESFRRSLRRLGRPDAACPAVSTAFRWPNLAPHLVEMLPSTPGKWETTIDSRVQALAENALLQQRQNLLTAGVEDGAVVVLENAEGKIRALVGSISPRSSAGQVNAALALRQAGSTLKPFLYSMYLEAGNEPETMIDDAPRCFRTADDVFCPQNLGLTFHGRVPVRVALGSSLNVPAVKVLETIGVESFSAKLMELGLLERAKPDLHGLGLALGVAEVRLLDLTIAFSSFIRGGELSGRRVLESTAPKPVQRVFSRSTANSIVSILSDQEARVPGFGEHAHLPLAFPLVMKTGTSTYGRDLWALGSTQDWTVGVWTGNADGRPTTSLSVETSVPILTALAQELTEETRHLSLVAN